MDLGTFPGLAEVNVRVADRWMAVARPFWPRAQAFIGPRGIYVTDTSRPEIEVFSFDGTLKRTLVLDRPAIPVTASDLETARDMAASHYAEDRRADFLTAWQQVEKPEMFPYYLFGQPDGGATSGSPTTTRSSFLWRIYRRSDGWSSTQTVGSSPGSQPPKDCFHGISATTTSSACGSIRWA